MIAAGNCSVVRGRRCCSSRRTPPAPRTQQRRRAQQQPVRCSAAKVGAAPGTHQLNFNNCLDRKHKGKALRAIIQLSPGALQGLSSKSDELLAGLQIKTIEDLGRWKHFRAARAIAALAPTEEAGGRPAGAASNINGVLDKQHEASSLQDILALPPSALQGLGPKSDELLAALGVLSVADLAAWKFAVWADALATLAEHEREDFSSS